jgi:tetratricopeptide (TPR) repeat protein
VPLVLLAWAFADVTGPACAQQTGSGGSSWTDTVTAPFRWTADKFNHALNPKPTSAAIQEDDAISLKNGAHPGSQTYVALARVYEQAGKTAEAEAQYQLALKQSPDDLSALLGYAHLKEQLGKPAEALDLYQRATKKYPQQASVHNNLGLCLARQNRLDEAAAAIGQAIQLEPTNLLYRNNIAAILVDQNKSQEAFLQLRQVHGDAVANYNMGYLLNKKGRDQAAMVYFGQALKADPSMVAARQWLDRLARAGVQAPPIAGVRTVNPSTTPRGEVVVTNDEPSPQRLPPTAARQPAADTLVLPGVNSDRAPMLTAPMPPRSPDTAVRPLPRVE